jgi:hypothetical protein
VQDLQNRGKRRVFRNGAFAEKECVEFWDVEMLVTFVFQTGRWDRVTLEELSTTSGHLHKEVIVLCRRSGCR